MRIEHLALWVKDLELMKNFYETYFAARAGSLYHNESKAFKSYFLSFDSGCRLELMQRADMQRSGSEAEHFGLAHFAVSVGSSEKVDQLTARLDRDGYIIYGKPRTTGDGYYESVVQDPEGNRIEITI